jgi:hypothetical protein
MYLSNLTKFLHAAIMMQTLIHFAFCFSLVDDQYGFERHFI